MADTYLTLGGFPFVSDFAVPQTINGGGAQRLVTHRMIGGSRVIDAMGPDDDAIRWNGIFRGGAASLQASLLDVMRRRGRPVILSYWTFRYKVVVSRFVFHFNRFYEIPYEIECTVAKDMQAKSWGQMADSAAGLFGSDIDLGTVIAGTAAAGNLALAMAKIAQSGVNSASSGNVMGAVTAALSVAATASLAADAITSAIGEAGSDAASMGQSLTDQGSALQESSAGVQGGGVLGRLITNLGGA